MKQQLIIISICTGIIGFFIGYVIASQSVSMPTMQHMMPDGTMMQGMNMEASMHAMMMGLEGKTGDALDKAFLEEMIVHHQGAIDMAEVLLAGTTRPELRALGTAIIAAQTSEIDMMKQWLRDWFSVTK